MAKEYVDGQREQDIIDRGDIVRKAYNGRFGDILRALVNGAVSSELKYHKVNPQGRDPLSADRILGRCEAFQQVIDDLEIMIAQADALLVPVEDISEE